MNKNRLEAFSDGVIAIIITIMVLNLEIPHNAGSATLLAMVPKFIIYIFSFMSVATLWVSHHNVVHDFVKQVTPRILWSNNLLLLCMSLVPFATDYVSEYYKYPIAIVVYCSTGIILSLSFMLFNHNINKHVLMPKVYRNKSLRTIILYIICMPLSLLSVYISLVLIALIPIDYFLFSQRGGILVTNRKILS